LHPVQGDVRQTVPQRHGKLSACCLALSQGLPTFDDKEEQDTDGFGNISTEGQKNNNKHICIAP